MELEWSFRKLMELELDLEWDLKNKLKLEWSWSGLSPELPISVFVTISRGFNVSG